MDKVKDKEWLKGRMKFPTGFCNEHGKVGQHEGHKPKDAVSGKPLPTCEFSETCPCKCHYDIDELFSMTNRERQVIPNPEYVPVRGEFVMPVYGEPVLDDVAVTPGDAMTHPNGEDVPTPTPAPSLAPLAARRTDTGRAARGGLEAQVWEAVTEWGKGGLDVLCTPKMVSEWIANKYVIPLPSSGAINAVWDRWERDGYATQGKKPVRFTGFVGDSSWEHLQRIKSSKRTAKKSAQAEASRSFRR